jgi:hypothetical protein
MMQLIASSDEKLEATYKSLGLREAELKKEDEKVTISIGDNNQNDPAKKTQSEELTNRKSRLFVVKLLRVIILTIYEKLRRNKITILTIGSIIYLLQKYKIITALSKLIGL